MIPIVALIAGSIAVAATPAASATPVSFPAIPSGATDLESDILKAVAEADFSGTYDFDTETVSQYTPQVDVAVLELDEQGNIRDRANVLVSRDYPKGTIAPIDANLDSSSVRFLKWDQSKFDSATYGTGTDIVPGRETAPLRYMSSYPASLLKSMVAFGLVFLSDHGAVDLDSLYTFNGVTKSVSTWTSEMIQYSNNTSAQAMIKMLHGITYDGQSGINFLNAELQRLGLTTLQLQGTSASTGGGWSNGGVTMTSFDTVRLDLLLDGGNGQKLWTTPGGLDVTSDTLSQAGRAWLMDIWSGTAYHWLLDTGNFCNWTTPYTGSRRYPATGIPAVVPESTLNPDGTSKIAWAGSPFATIDVRPCNDQAEVTFYNKYGLTYNAGADAGIVKNLPNKPFRHYIISVMTNIGYRYGDAELAPTGNACLSNASSFCYTERLPLLAGKIDQAIKGRGTTPAKVATTTTLALPEAPASYPAPTVVKASVLDGTVGATVEISDGSGVVGSGTLTSDGVATIALDLTTGEHTVVANYLGDGVTHPSRSATTTLSVKKGDPEFQLSVTPVDSAYGTAVVVSGSVSAGAQGTVAFFLDGVQVGVVPVEAGAAKLSLPTLSVGKHVLSATYSGSELYGEANAEVAATVTKAGTLGTLTAEPSVYGKPVKLSVSLPPAVTGSVALAVDGKFVKTGSVTAGKLSTTLSKVAAGRHTVTATYPGSATQSAVTIKAAFTVEKARPGKVAVSAKPFRASTKPVVIVHVGSLNNGAKPTGRVAVYVGKKKVVTRKLKASANGKVVVRLPKKYAKKISVTARFTPSDTKNIVTRTSAKKVIKVKK